MKTPQDIEAALNMPGGHIFHGDLQWPWLAEDSTVETPADRWGVATGVDNVLVCGSGRVEVARSAGSAGTTPRWRRWRCYDGHDGAGGSGRTRPSRR